MSPPEATEPMTWQLLPLDERLLFRGTPDDPRLGAQVSRSIGPSAAPARTVALVGFADDRGITNGGGRPGAAAGPTELRRFLYKLTPGGRGELSALNLVDLGDATPSPSLSIEQVHALGQAALASALSSGALAIALGGGHDVAFASHSALFETLPPGTTVAALNVDAHLDLRPLRDGTQVTSGTPFRRLLQAFGRRYSLTEFGIQQQHNARAHLAFAREHHVRVLELTSLRKRGKVVAQFAAELKRARKGSHAIAVSICLDAVEAASAPGVSAPCPDGFTASELYAFARLAGREPKVRLLDVMELSPPLDVDGRTARLAAAAVWHFLAGVGERRG